MQNKIKKIPFLLTKFIFNLEKKKKLLYFDKNCLFNLNKQKMTKTKYKLSLMAKPDEIEQPDAGTVDDTTTAAKVILFNDEWHTFDEVIDQIIKATNCNRERAEALTWEVHNKGKACVYDGEMHECIKVSAVLEEISLHTQIEY